MVTEDNFKAHQGFDLTDWDPDEATDSTPKVHRVLRTSTLADFAKSLAESQRLPPEQVRLWVMVNRQNKTIRPDQPLSEPEMTVDEAYSKYGGRDKSFRLFLERASRMEEGNTMWPDIQSPNTINNQPMLIFLKYFDAEAQTLKGVGHIYVKKQCKVAEVVPMILQLMGWSHGSHGLSNGLTNGTTSPPTLALYEEIKHSMIEPMKPKSTLHQAEIQDGDIVCFQKVLSEKQALGIAQAGGYTDAREFYDYLLNRKTVSFSPKFPTDSESEIFKLDLSRKMTYEQFSAKVGEYLKVDPTHLRFSTVNSTTGKIKNPVKRNATQNLYQILSPQFGTYSNNNQRDDALYYEILDMSLSELDTKKSLKISWVTEGMSKEVCALATLSLYFKADVIRRRSTRSSYPNRARYAISTRVCNKKPNWTTKPSRRCGYMKYAETECTKSFSQMNPWRFSPNLPHSTRKSCPKKSETLTGGILSTASISKRSRASRMGFLSDFWLNPWVIL